MKDALTTWKLIDQQGADAHYVFLIHVGAAVYLHLVWEGSIDAQVPIHTKERLDAPLPVPVGGFVKVFCNPRKNLPHNLLHPSAVQVSEREGAEHSSNSLYPNYDWHLHEGFDFHKIVFVVGGEICILKTQGVSPVHPASRCAGLPAGTVTGAQ